MAEYYVSNDSTGSPLGSNAYDGLSPTVDGGGVGPWLTVSYGAQQLSAGDTLWVRAGTYVEYVQWSGSYPQGTSGNVITVENYDSEVVTIAPGAQDRCLYFTDTEYITFRGLVLDGTSTQYDGVKMTLGGGGVKAHHITLDTLEIKNAGENGILNSGPNNTVTNCHIYDMAQYENKGHGVYSTHHHLTLTGCHIHDGPAYGVHQYDEGSQSGINSDNSLSNNVIHDCVDGMIIGSGDNNIAWNNIIYGNSGRGLIIGVNGASNCHAYNNTVYNNTGLGISLWYTSSTHYVKNNICWANGTNVVTKDVGASGATLVDSNNSVLDPGFLSTTPADPDFLKIDSDSTNTYNLGVDLTAYFTDDIDGNARPQDLLWDIGAYEFVTAIPDEPPVNTIGNQTAVQSVASPITGISVADVNADCLTVWLALEDGKGTLSGSTVGTATGTFV